MRARGCLVAVAVVLALVGVVAAVFGPGALRRARQVYAPISRMKDEQRDFEAWVRQQNWHAPATPALSAEKLDAFLALRRELRGLDQRAESFRGPASERRRARFEDMPAIMEGVGGLVSDRLQAFRRHNMVPAEYDSLDRLVYEKWLPTLLASRADPAARDRAAVEIEKAAGSETSPAVRARLRQVAASLRQSVPPPPEGIPPEVHQLLLTRAGEIESQPTGRIAARVARPREGRPESTASP
ncbi:MAG: hypothetical protein DMF78_06730 [Acidobacteria bacterium]|nr:MAG: hypothetical protein DMF78_06730 [Acidobacteriota bacterium]